MEHNITQVNEEDVKKKTIKRGSRTQREARHEVIEERKIVECIPQENSNRTETKTYIDRKTLTFNQVQWSECSEEISKTRSYLRQRRVEALKTFRQNLAGKNMTTIEQRVRCSIVSASMRDRQKNIPRQLAYLAITPGLSPSEQQRRVKMNVAAKNKNEAIESAICASEALKKQAEDCEAEGLSYEDLQKLAQEGNVVAKDIVLAYSSSLSSKKLNEAKLPRHLKKAILFHLPMMLHTGCYTEKGKFDIEMKRKVAPRANVINVIRGGTVLYNDFCGTSIHHLVPTLSSRDLESIFASNGGRRAGIDKEIRAHFTQASKLRLSDVETVINSFVRNIASKLREGNRETVLEAWRRYLICWRMMAHYLCCYEVTASHIKVTPPPFDFIRRLTAIHPDWMKEDGADHIRNCAASCEAIFSTLHPWKMGSKGLEHHFKLWPFDPASDQKSGLANI